MVKDCKASWQVIPFLNYKKIIFTAGENIFKMDFSLLIFLSSHSIAMSRLGLDPSTEVLYCIFSVVSLSVVLNHAAALVGSSLKLDFNIP